MCGGAMSLVASKWAMVRETLKICSYARAQVQLRHRDANQLLGIGSQFAMRFQMPRAHARVAICFRVARKTLVLFLSSTSDSFANSGGIFLRAFARHIAIFHRRHFDVQIDPVDQR